MRVKMIIGIAAAAAAFVTSAAPASAAPTCREVDTSSPTPPPVTVCFDLRQYGTTFAPWAETTLCVGYICGTNEWVDMGTTGYSPAGRIPPVQVDPATGSVRWPGGDFGTVWVNGQAVRLIVSGFCVGDPNWC